MKCRVVETRMTSKRDIQQMTRKLRQIARSRRRQRRARQTHQARKRTNCPTYEIVAKPLPEATSDENHTI